MSNFQKIQQIVKEKQYQKINGMIVDGYSAKAVINVYNALNKEHKARYKKIINTNLKKAVDIAFKLHNKR